MKNIYRLSDEELMRKACEFISKEFTQVNPSEQNSCFVLLLVYPNKKTSELVNRILTKT